MATSTTDGPVETAIRTMERIAIEAVEGRARAEIALIDYQTMIRQNALRRDYDLLRLERAELRVRNDERVRIAREWIAAAASLSAFVKSLKGRGRPGRRRQSP